MAVAHDASSESHTGTTGSASEGSFTWDHTPVGVPAGVLVFTFVNVNADNALGVTYAGLELTAVPGGRAADVATEPGQCKAWFLGRGLPTGLQAVVVTRTNNANVMYAAAITVTALCNTEVVLPPVLQQDNSVAVEQPVDTKGRQAQRYAGTNSGLADIVTALTAGANSTALVGIDFGARVCLTVRETTPGTGSRNVGFSGASDDFAGVFLAVSEIPPTPFENYKYGRADSGLWVGERVR